MLWQPSLPERYTKAKPEDLARDIAARRRELGEKLVILGHHYQTDEVIQHADFIGDSLKLSQTAARIAKERDVEWVVFCGVHFMAETADMLTPDRVSVILPDLSAGCSMADMAAYEDTVEAWDLLHAALNEQAGGAWKGRVIPITYVNSTAAIKAFVGAHGGACCTSSNADKVFAWAMQGGETERREGEEIKVLFLPDQHLGRNTASKFGIDVVRHTNVYAPRRTRAGEPLGGIEPERLLETKAILWAGHCSVHKLFRPEHCDAIRAQNQGLAAGQRWKILVHPECAKEVVDRADLAGSTEFIIKTLREAPRGSRWAVGTEVHLVTRLSKECAERGVEVRILSDCQCLCTTMFRIDQPHLLWVLDHLAGAHSKDGSSQIVNAIRVHPEVRRDALLALDRMLKHTGVATLAAAD
jgi:quinolinate synthase